MRQIRGENQKSKLEFYNPYSQSIKLPIIRPFTNFGMEEDAEDPREPAHLDYKYLKAFAGPLSIPNNPDDIKENKQDSSEQEKEPLMKSKTKSK